MITHHVGSLLSWRECGCIYLDSPMLFRNFSASFICCSIRSFCAELSDGCNLAWMEEIVLRYPVTLWKIRTCFSPPVKTYFPSESNKRHEIGPRKEQTHTFALWKISYLLIENKSTIIYRQLSNVEEKAAAKQSLYLLRKLH